MQTRIIESTINRRIDDTRGSLDFANKMLQDAHQNILNLKHQQVTIYEKIATIFLLESPQNDNKQIQALVTQLQELFIKLNTRSQELEQLTLESLNKVSDTLSKIDTLTIEKVMLLEHDPNYVSLFNLLKNQEENIENETLAFNESQKEFSQKLAQYYRNSCYNYLIKRRFGQQDYCGFWIFRNLDAWAARYVNFTENYKNQRILESLIKESQNRYDNKKESYQLTLQQKEQKEQEVEDKLKLPVLRDQLAQKQRILAGYQEQKAQIYQNLNETQLGKGNQFYEIAHQLAEVMRQQSISSLEHLTRQTKSKEDDLLLQDLTGIERQIRKLEGMLPSLKQNCEAIEHTYNRFNQVFFIFKQNNIPSGFYEYNLSPSSLNQLLDKLLNKAVFPETIAHAIIANRMKINRNRSSSGSSGWSVGWGNSATTPSSSYRRSPSGGFSSRSSSSSKGSGFSSTSSSGGGGFKTTDSF
ncbi:hypothetical protein RHO13_06870 [Orbus wheelerorum]|uniref:hypothetical protein n=1 Tax=Orbus wheelerorum TaxID=3074111 RepID=UPI00370DD85E